MIFQNPRTALNPIRPVGRQIADVLVRHGNVPRREAPAQAVEMLRAVGITDPARRAKAYPFEMSGGMCQRVMIAIALAAKPSLLIADEPTTGLDVTTQAVIMDLISDLASELGMATIFITHDLALAGQRAARIVVMHAGHVVENAPTKELFAHPRHPYTAELIAATPDSAVSLDDLASIPGSLPDLRRDRSAALPLFRALPAQDFGLRAAAAAAASVADHERRLLESLSRGWQCALAMCRWAHHDRAARCCRILQALSGRRRAGTDRACCGAALPAARRSCPKCTRSTTSASVINKGETVGLVGESGCGKSTLVRALTRLIDASDGSVKLGTRELSLTPAKDFARDPDRARIQMVFQDAGESVNPRFTALCRHRRSAAAPAQIARQGAD